MRFFRLFDHQLEFLYQPPQLLSCLCDLINQAHHHITLASLYFGGDESTARLFSALDQALSRAPLLTLSLLMDAKRGRRQDPDTQRAAAALSQLQHRFGPQRVRITPLHVAHPLDPLLPPRLDEITGVQHLKAAVIDDHLLLTGANFSDQYWRQRQDRGVWLREAPEVAAAVRGALGGFGEAVGETGRPSLGQRGRLAQRLLESFGAAALPRRDLFEPLADPRQVKLFFGVQVPFLDLPHDAQILDQLLALPCRRLQLSSPYLNLTARRQQQLFGPAAVPKERIELLTSAPESNGFHGAPDAARFIPAAYAQLQKELVRQTQAQKQVWHREYRRPEWTFHAKGLWWETHGDRPSVGTMIGSGNLSYRSEFRDLEMMCYLVATPGQRVDHMLQEEWAKLVAFATPVNMEIIQKRVIPNWITQLSPLLKKVL